jgi:hypothetical protein
MEKKDHTPLWVFLAFSSINSRKGALWLLWSSIIFTLYCVPWDQLFHQAGWINTVFLIDDWSWFTMMVPITIWYWLSLRWTDRNAVWETST